MNWEERDLRHIWHPCSQMKDYEELPPIIVDRAEGVWLYDQSGKKYLDIISSWWCNLLGHCHPQINEAIKKQLDCLEHVIFANFSHKPAILLCEELKEYLPSGLCRFHFSDNGSAAVECALKMAFQYQLQTGQVNRRKFLCLSGGYHGETIGALAVGALDLYTQMYKPLLMETETVPAPDCYRCPYDRIREHCQVECFEQAEQIFAQWGKDACAFIVEPLLQGSAGMRIYPPLYLRKLRQLCDAYGVLLIADEIATGFGRTGSMFACEQAGITPDILCLSKGLTGGYMPMSLTVTTEQIYQAFYADYREGKAFMHSHTYSGNPLGCAAARAVLRILTQEQILEQAAVQAQYLTKRMTEVFGEHRHVGEIRHLGLIHALELVQDKESKTAFATDKRLGYAIYKQALHHGLLLRPLGDVLYFNPPLIVAQQELEEAIDLCFLAMHEVLKS